VTDAEIKTFYEKNKASFALPESYHIAHILVTPVAEPDQEWQKRRRQDS
jgi:parvulin-like peptidyl-prolyl isomerase